MTKTDQEIFYKNLGSIVKRQRLANGMSIAYLARASGEQNKTIRCIEAGRPCNLHHLTWIESVLGISISGNELLIYGRESTSDKANINTVEDLI